VLRQSENPQLPEKDAVCPSIIPVSSASNSGRGRGSRQRAGRAVPAGVGIEESQAVDEGGLELASLELLEVHATLTDLQGDFRLPPPPQPPFTVSLTPLPGMPCFVTSFLSVFFIFEARYTCGLVEFTTNRQREGHALVKNYPDSCARGVDSPPHKNLAYLPHYSGPTSTLQTEVVLEEKVTGLCCISVPGAKKMSRETIS